jgi:hypothetical protein
MAKVKALKSVGHLGQVYTKGTIFELGEEDAQNHVRCQLVELAGEDAVVDGEDEIVGPDASLSLEELESKWPFDIDPAKYLKQFPQSEESELAALIVEKRAAVKTEAE